MCVYFCVVDRTQHGHRGLMGGSACGVGERGRALLDVRDGEREVGVGNLIPASTLSQHSVRHRNVQRFRGGLVFKAHRPLFYSTLGLRVKKKKNSYHPTVVYAVACFGMP